MIDPIDEALSRVPKAPLLIPKLALSSGVLGASDMIEIPKRKKIMLK